MTLTLEQAAAQLADALAGAMVAARFDGNEEFKDEGDATWWFCRKACWDYAEARRDGWQPYMSDDRDSPPATVAYALKLAELGSFGWVVEDARKSP